MKSKGSKPARNPARWGGILVIVAAMAALAMTAGRMKRRGKRSSQPG